MLQEIMTLCCTLPSKKLITSKKLQLIQKFVNMLLLSIDSNKICRIVHSISILTLQAECSGFKGSTRIHSRPPNQRRRKRDLSQPANSGTIYLLQQPVIEYPELKAIELSNIDTAPKCYGQDDPWDMDKYTHFLFTNKMLVIIGTIFILRKYCIWLNCIRVTAGPSNPPSPKKSKRFLLFRKFLPRRKPSVKEEDDDLELRYSFMLSPFNELVI